MMPKSPEIHLANANSRISTITITGFNCFDAQKATVDRHSKISAHPDAQSQDTGHPGARIARMHFAPVSSRGGSVIDGSRLRSADAIDAYNQRIRGARDAHVRDAALYCSCCCIGTGVVRRVTAEPLDPPAATGREHSALTSFLDRMRAAQVRAERAVGRGEMRFLRATRARKRFSAFLRRPRTARQRWPSAGTCRPGEESVSVQAGCRAGWAGGNGR